MTRTEYENSSFDELMDILDGERDDIHTYEDMKDFAIHILEGIRNSPAEWFLYDYSMGIFDTVKGITCKEDVEDLIDE